MVNVHIDFNWLQILILIDVTFNFKLRKYFNLRLVYQS